MGRLRAGDGGLSAHERTTFRYTRYGPVQEADEAIRDRTVLFIDNDAALEALAMDECIDALDTLYRDIGSGFTGESRNTFHTPLDGGGGWHYWRCMAGTSATLGVAVVRVISIAMHDEPGAPRIEGYAGTPGKHLGLIHLFDVEDGAPLAIIADGHVQHMRVAATGALSVRHMAREDASVLGLFGTSGMADTHAWAISRVRPIERIQVYSPNPRSRAAFVANMSELLGIDVVAVDTPEQVVAEADVVAACTSSRVPVIRGDWLRPGVHAVAIHPGELDDEVFRRCDRYAYSRSLADRHHFAAPEARPHDMVDGDPDTEWIAREERFVPAERRSFLSELVLGRAEGRTGPDEITCFVSQGNALQFAPVALKVYERARERGLGRPLPLSWFLEDIRE